MASMTATAAAAALPLADRIAIVTGGSRGIGRAIVTYLHSQGASVAINYSSNSAQADLLVSELGDPTAKKPRAVAVKANISHPDEVKRLFDAAEEAFDSRPHIFVNCAGVLDPKYPTIASTETEDFDRIFEVNARGAFLCLREASRRVIQGGGGRIVMLTTSVVGGLMPGYGAYAASKAAVETMTKIAAKELKGTGITANCVAPGPIATEMFYAGKTEETVKRIVDACPMGRIGEVKDVAEVVGFLVGDGGGWVNGQFTSRGAIKLLFNGEAIRLGGGSTNSLVSSDLGYTSRGGCPAHSGSHSLQDPGTIQGMSGWGNGIKRMRRLCSEERTKMTTVTTTSCPVSGAWCWMSFTGLVQL